MASLVHSFESESIATICGPSDAIDDSVTISPDISVELRKIGVVGLGGLGSFDDCSTKNEAESLDSGENGGNISILVIEKMPLNSIMLL